MALTIDLTAITFLNTALLMPTVPVYPMLLIHTIILPLSHSTTTWVVVLMKSVTLSRMPSRILCEYKITKTMTLPI
jgi:hypothetical protein